MRIFMCSPQYFDVVHKNLNYHMKMLTSVHKQKAYMQHWNLTHLLKNVGMKVSNIEPQPGLVDMVFAANGALLHNKTAVVSNFHATARVSESRHWSKFLHDHGYDVHTTVHKFEGQGDALFSHDKEYLWMGHGFRTEVNAQNDLQKYFPESKVHSLHLVDPRFYHLDTCFCVLKESMVMYHSPAFDKDSQEKIESCFDVCIDVSNEDATNFACNAVVFDKIIILHCASDDLKRKLRAHDMTVIETNMSEFLLSGGSVKCCVLHA